MKMTEEWRKLWFAGQHSYEGILKSVCSDILLTVNDGDYQGEVYALVRKWEDNEYVYGIAQWSYGSCSHCDAIEACDSAEDFKEVYEQMVHHIRWDTLTRTLLYLEEHDWEGEAGFFYRELKTFPERAKRVLIAYAAGYNPRFDRVYQAAQRLGGITWRLDLEIDLLKKACVAQEGTERKRKILGDIEEVIDKAQNDLEALRKVIG
jgi:hypothetical protein